MNDSKSSLMLTIFFSTGQGKKHYTVSSISAFQNNLQKYHKIKIKRRWIFYCFRWLLDEGYIRRKERYRNYNNGLIRQIPSMITITLKGVVWLVSKGVAGAKKIYKNMVQFLKSGDKRWPHGAGTDDGSFWPADPEVKEGLEKMLGIVTKEIE